jgi:hypothetical protein
MTQTNVSVDRLAEFKALFWGLDEIGQEAAIIILKSLEFAQSVVINSQKLILEGAVEGSCESIRKA